MTGFPSGGDPDRRQVPGSRSLYRRAGTRRAGSRATCTCGERTRRDRDARRPGPRRGCGRRGGRPGRRPGRRGRLFSSPRSRGPRAPPGPLRAPTDGLPAWRAREGCADVGAEVERRTGPRVRVPPALPRLRSHPVVAQVLDDSGSMQGRWVRTSISHAGGSWYPGRRPSPVAGRSDREVILRSGPGAGNKVGAREEEAV